MCEDFFIIGEADRYRAEGFELKKMFFRFVSLAAAALTASAVTSGVSAEEFVYAFDDATLVDEIEADTYDIDGTEISIEKELGDAEVDPGMSVRCVLFNEYINAEFWNDPNVTVSVDVRLDTEGADVIGYIIGFDSKWTWINPSKFTKLKYNDWVTITETGEHFYHYFQKNEPLRLLFQTRSNWGVQPQGSVKVTLKNFRISNGAAAAEPTVESFAPESSDTETPEASTPAVSSTPVPDTSSDIPDTSSTVSTSIQTASAASTSINYADIDLNVSEQTEKSTAMVFIVIIVAAAVVVAGIVVGYLIYKKKKYY